MSNTSTVKGILKDSSGKPVIDAIVMIVEGPGEFNDIASVSNEKGEFYMSNVQVPGTYVLQIRGNDQQKRKSVNVSSKDAIISITY